MWQELLEGGVALVAAFLIGTLVEYTVHRLMHGRVLLHKKHAEHHRDGWGQGWLGEFGDYFIPCIPVMWLGFLYSLPAGIGWALGGFFYAAFAAYAHQLQHENADMVFWMRRPVHYLHHKHHMWKHNFGIAVDWWDHVFGTYQKVEWQREKPMREHGFRALFRITWLWRKEDATEATRADPATTASVPAGAAAGPMSEARQTQ